ncbi:MAG: S8 family serine peptidase [Minicystis sp.]
MDLRDILVRPGSQLLDQQDTTVLHRYPSGEVLIRTSEATSEKPVDQGVRLSPDLAANLEGARAGFAALDAASTDVILAYVEMVGPIARAWLTRLQELGVTPLRFQPANAYLCRASVADLKRTAQEPFVLRVTPLTPDLKPRPRIGEPAAVWIVAHGAGDPSGDVVSAIRALPGVEIEAGLPVEDVNHFLHVPARVTPAGADAARKLPSVLAIEVRKAPEAEDELANLIVAGQYDGNGKPVGSYLRWLEDKGLSGLGVAIGIVDAGVDTSHVAFSGRIKDLADGARDWHGTFVAGHAAGAYLDEKDSRGFIYGVGVAPRAEIIVQNNQKGAAELCRETVRATGPGGARGAVQNNSWGTGLSSDPEAMNYGALEASYDSLVRNADPESGAPRPLVICFSSGNSGNQGLTRPKAAKNIIVTGNSENWRPDAGNEDADDIGEVYTGPHGSSWGNCGDGRIRPDVVAPGEWTASANFDSHPGEKEYISPKLTWGGGSSAASPKTAGACALLIQWWRRHGCEPSPALVRALIVNGAEPMGFRQPIPNRYEGWGRLNLASILDDRVSRVHEDQTVLLREFGEKKEWLVRVADPRRPVKITLSWTDPPGAVGSGDSPANSAIVNSLVLRAFVGSLAYRGNNFQNGWSVSPEVPGAQAEGADNLQNIFLPAGAVDGAFRVVVEARNITANCRDPRSVDPQQDFALVITNACLDEARAPADVFLGVDAGASGEPAGDGGDHWQPGEGNDDHAELGGGPPAASTPMGAPTTQRDEDAWWDAGDSFARKEATRSAEAARSAATSDAGGVPAVSRRLAEAAATGVNLVTGGAEGRVAMAAAIVGESGEGSPLVQLAGGVAGGDVRAVVTQNVVAPLSLALRRLTASFPLMGSRRRSAVLVVGRGTRVTSADLIALRRIALLGQLHLIADDAGVLQFLAQRLDKRRGVSFRLAGDADGIPALVRDTLAEASGGRRLLTEQGEAAADTGWVAATHRFDIVPADRRFTVSVSHTPGAAPRVRVRRPRRAAFDSLEPEDVGAPDGAAFFTAQGDFGGAEISVHRRDTLVTIAISAAEAALWEGPWEIENRRAGARRRPAQDRAERRRARVGLG